MIHDTAPVSVDGHREAPPRRPVPWERRLRAFGHTVPPHTPLRERLVPPFSPPPTGYLLRLGLSPRAARRLARCWGWGGPLAVALLAGALRLWRLGRPHELVFDETYYAKDGWSLLRLGYEGTWPARKVADPMIVADPQGIPLGEAGAFVAHPPMGKWVIALGEWMFGLTPLGWRIMPALLGTLSVLMLCRIGRRLFRSTALGCLAGVLLALDGLHLVMSRTALLDIVVTFFVLAAFGCLLIDRDRARARLAAALPQEPDGSLRPDAPVADRAGLGPRPWRIAAGVLLGLATATKWNGLYFLAFFAVLTVVWDVSARRVAGARRPWRSALRRDLPGAALGLLPVAALTYLVTWTGWLRSDGGYGRHWADQRDTAWPWIPAALRSLWHYQSEVYRFNVGLDSPHSYQSHPWAWIVQARPVLFHYESVKDGRHGCTAGEGCTEAVLAVGTPLLWWTACAALLHLLYRWGLRRDWRAGAVLCGAGAGWLPWFLYTDRTIFSFYSVVFVPYLCLAVAMTLGALAGPGRATAAPAGLPRPGPNRRLYGLVGAGALTLLIVWNFLYFYPVYTAQTIPFLEWARRIWMGSWI